MIGLSVYKWAESEVSGRMDSCIHIVRKGRPTGTLWQQLWLSSGRKEGGKPERKVCWLSDKSVNRSLSISPKLLSKSAKQFRRGGVAAVAPCCCRYGSLMGDRTTLGLRPRHTQPVSFSSCASSSYNHQ
eukprot:GHVU01157141.1.p1 GENE.GHVU01157141.1~~GHVU01157141.1.p1  ORF type:complete len:129 (-),score=2.04 GHVU01157141.1:1195-1581(-)